MAQRPPPTDALVSALRRDRGATVRLGQTASLLATLAIIAAEASIGGSDIVARPVAVPFVAALAVIVVATPLAFVVPWHRLRPGRALALAAVTMLAIGTLQASGPTGTVVGIASVVPASWLGLQHRWRGVVVAGALAVVVAVASAAGESGPNAPMARAVDAIIPVLVLFTAAAMAVAHDVWDLQARQLHRQRHELEQIVETARDSSDLLAAIFGVVDSGLLVVDASGRYTTMNAAMRRFRARIGAADSAYAGDFLEIWEADRTTPVPADRTPSGRAARGETFQGETYWFGADRRTQIAATVSARQLSDREGEARGALLVYQDVTPQMLALHAKDEFVASVSHELRTPLTSIVGYLELLSDAEQTETTRRQLDVVARNADRLLSLVTDLLTVAQADGGQLRILRSQADLAEIVGRAVQSAQVRADHRGVELAARTGSVPPMHVDARRIGQVLDNLLSNSIKYTPTGGTVIITLEAGADEAVVTVADTGIGIAEDEQQLLFTKFFRSQEVERAAIPGAGLGLVITKAIVDQHGGTIEVVSAVGTGTTVTVRLPRSPR